MKLMGQLSIRSRLLIAVLVPVLITASVTAWMTARQLNASGEAEVQRLRAGLLEAHKTGLKNLVDGARALIREEYDDQTYPVEEAQQRVRDKLRSIVFGDNNYLYAYRDDAYVLIFAPNPAGEGHSKKTTDASRALLAKLFDVARTGDGFYQYEWDNPANPEPTKEPKLSYSLTLERWNWVIGAGVYITDIDHAVAAAREDIRAQIRNAMLTILAITATIVLIAVGFGLFIGRSVTVPLNRVTRTMEDIARGEGDLTRRLPAEGKDELAG